MLTDEFAEVGQFKLDAETIRLLPRALCERHTVVVLEASNTPGTVVTVGMFEPETPAVRLQIADFLQREIRVVRLNRYEIERAIAWGYDAVLDEAVHLAIRRPSQPDDDAPAMVDYLLAEAVAAGASDVHLERFMNDVDVRFRIDGILHQTFTHIDPKSADAVINRLKVMSGLDITERRRPQDGRIRVRIRDEASDDRVVDVRLSMVPGPAGEDVVMRVLDASRGLLPISALGMSPAMETTFATLLQNPEGLILVTGPTGSGKTTSLYAALNQVNDGSRKVITAEDPIEYYLPKINQKQVNAQMPMATLLRSLLRQDPDVLLVGEIRDIETGSTALSAAATGHVVLGTLHTSDALGAVPRLRGLELDDAEISDALLAVLAQRLVRKVCEHCAQTTAPTPEQSELFGTLLDGIDLPGAVGCEACHHTGYSGRTGIFELLVVDRELQQRIAEGEPATALADHVFATGHRTLVDEALDKLREGVTTLNELVRILPYRQVVWARRRSGAPPSG